MSVKFTPRARQSAFLSETVDDELLLYDESRHLACRLNRTAATVWQNSDGKRTVEDLVALLRAEIGDLADEDLVMVTLDRLEEQGLIEAGYSRRDADAVRLSRRRFIRRAGAVGAAALALPVVHGVVAPTPAQALSTYTYPFETGDRKALIKRYDALSPAQRQALIKRYK
jgi:DNA-binding transcriptional ArsR family regulator